MFFHNSDWAARDRADNHGDRREKISCLRQTIAFRRLGPKSYSDGIEPTLGALAATRPAFGPGELPLPTAVDFNFSSERCNLAVVSGE